MIVRKPNSGEFAGSLLLIRQSDHAALSRDLAESWGLAPFAEIAIPQVTMPAILHHDDGWDEWEKAPKIDVASRRPQSFLTTSAEDSHQVWTGSVRRCAEFGPLAEYLVAKHFLILRKHSGSAETSVGSSFLDRVAADCQTWLDQWQQSEPSQDHTDEDVDLALAQLRFFDWFSLWLCLAERDKEYEFPETPGNQRLTIFPQVAAHDDENEPQLMQADPWPWHRPMVDVSIAARVVPDRDYRDGEDLMSEYGQETTLRWQFKPRP